MKFQSNHKPKSKTNDLELVSDWAPGSEGVGEGEAGGVKLDLTQFKRNNVLLPRALL